MESIFRLSIASKSACTVIFFLLISATGRAEEASFNRIECHSTISSDLLITSPGNSVKLIYEERDQALRPLVRALLSPSVPDSLVQAYHCLELDIQIPQSSCRFSEANPEKFTCHHAQAETMTHFRVKARLSCYDEEADYFDGEATEIEVQSNRRDDQGESYFEATVAIRLASSEQLFRFNTDGYIADFWNYDGYRHPPECTVDGAMILYSR